MPMIIFVAFMVFHAALVALSIKADSLFWALFNSAFFGFNARSVIQEVWG